MSRIPRGTIYWVRGDDPRINTTYLLDVPISGVTDGQVVAYNGTAYVPAIANNFTNAQALGLIVNSGASTGDLVVANGLVTGFSGLTPGAFYYLSQSSAGAITSTRPEHGLVVTVGEAISATTLLVTIKVEEANSNIRRSQPQSGCSNGQVVRWDGTNFVPASSADLSQNPLGIIQNVSGGTGDVYFGGVVPTTGMGTLTAGATYYLSLTAGAITTIRPLNGLVVTLGQALSSTAFNLNITQHYNDNLVQLSPINWAHKEAGMSFWNRLSGTGTLSYDTSNISAMGYGSFAITGTGVWELNTTGLSGGTLPETIRSHYPVSPLQGMGGVAQFRVNGGTGSLRFGTNFYTRDLVALTPAAGQDWWLFNTTTTSTTFAYAQNICRTEGTAVGTLPTNTRFIRAKIEIVTNPGTIWIDNFTVYPLTFATMALYG